MPGLDSEPKRMQCMEVWGGNHAVDTAVAMAGLDAWLYSRPHGEESLGGGDIHYVSSCAAGSITRLLLADVCGHGSAVSEVAIHLRNLMRRYINYHDQSRFIEEIDREFAQLTKSPGAFATAVAITFECVGNRFIMCNAGHPPPLRYDIRAARWEALDKLAGHDGHTGNIPLGIELQGSYGQVETRLHVGDLILCYTDSLTEARDPAGEVVGVDGLLALLQTHDIAEPAKLIPTLLDRIQQLNPRNLHEDDVTLLLFRPNGQSPRISLKNRLLIPYHLIRAKLQDLRSTRQATRAPA
jgi:phosphoserine phosphatase RsbU/P